MDRNNLMASILNVLPAGIMFCDMNCHIKFINEEYANMLGKNSEDILGKHVRDLIPQSRIPHVIDTGESEYNDLCILPTKDAQNSAIVNRVVLRSSEGKMLGVVSHAIFNSVYELHQLAKKHNEKTAQLNYKINEYQHHMKSALTYKYTLDSILGNNPSLQEQKELLSCYADVDSPVLILGETGTGKELFAHALHSASSRYQAPLVTMNCAAIPKELFESEMFGYAGGAFSGAHKDGKVGLVELADSGTLFLDEIGDLALDAQSKLLRFLEDKTFSRVGSVHPKTVEFRLICATNKDLQQMIKNGMFREDLYYRISSLQINVPSLRQRVEDIPILIKHFLRNLDREDLYFFPDTMQIMMSHSWHGNIRALRNAITHIASICPEKKVALHHLPKWMLTQMGSWINDIENNNCVEDDIENSAGESLTLNEIVSKHESESLKKHLRECGGNVSLTAKRLGTSRATLYSKFKKLGINHKMEMKKN
ncbi:sigma 54-interacting transcriptional regulator [Desulfonatronospira sp.]|uniref:sigma-54 interaction domain-containing protein n=1 Tax=Desulfonatronospira sp. TaxID=1962951 RepID=UPI0025BD0F30|nr:sigma 54-interacting transcriptional regulator [Desulfonatronospira sp.]